MCRRGGGGRVWAKYNYNTRVFKESPKQRRVWRDLNNLLSPGRETRTFFFLCVCFFFPTTKWHAVSSIPSSLSAVTPVKHIKAHCSAKPDLQHTAGCSAVISALISSSLLADRVQRYHSELINTTVLLNWNYFMRSSFFCLFVCLIPINTA